MLCLACEVWLCLDLMLKTILPTKFYCVLNDIVVVPPVWSFYLQCIVRMKYVCIIFPVAAAGKENRATSAPKKPKSGKIV